MVDFKLGEVRMTVIDDLRLASAKAWDEAYELEEECGLLDPRTLYAKADAVIYTDALELVSGDVWVYSRSRHRMVKW